MVTERAERRLAAILAADTVGYARLMEVDEAGTLAALKSLRESLIEPAIAGHKGRIVKTTGDGLLAEFASVVDAVTCAVAIQRAMAARNLGIEADRRIVFRIGVNLGDIIIDADDIYGDGVNIAARLEGMSDPGGIFLSGGAFAQLKAKVDVAYEDLGFKRLKNIAEPIRVYRVLLQSGVAGHTRVAASARLRRWRWPAAAAAAIVVALVLARQAGLLPIRPPAPEMEAASLAEMAFPLPDKPSVAVLPFDNLSGDKEQDYFADGLTEDLTTNLASFPNLFVIARHSTRKFKDQPFDIRDVAHDLGVQYVLEGSVRRAGDTVRVTAQLIDALNGTHLWAETYDRELADIFPLQDEITAEIGGRLVSKVVAAEFTAHSRRGTRNPEAYDLFLRGWYTIEVLNRENLVKAEQLFEAAAALDPGYARAFAGLAIAKSQFALFGWARGPDDTFDHALELAEKATALDPDDDFPYRMLAGVLRAQGEHDRAIKAYEEALARSPSNPDALIGLAFTNAYAGHGPEAVAYGEMAMRLNPHPQPVNYAWLGAAYYINRQYEKAIAMAKTYREINPKIPISFFWLAASYAQLGRMDEAEAARDELVARFPEYTTARFLAQTRAKGAARELMIEGFRKAGIPEG